MSLGMTSELMSATMPMTSEPMSAVGGTEAAERDGREHQQDQGRSGVPGDAVEVDAQQHAG